MNDFPGGAGGQVDGEPRASRTEDALLNRRRFIYAAGGLVALGLSGLAGYEWSYGHRPHRPSPVVGAHPPSTRPSWGRLPSAPSLASRRTVASGDVQRFRSRPDLFPPTVEVSTNKRGQAAGLVLMDSHAGPGQQGPIIVDGDGELVWFKPLSADATLAGRAFNLRAQVYQGKPVLTWFEGSVLLAHGQGDYVIADASYSEIARVHAGNGYAGDLHEFILTPSGTAFFTCYGVAYADLSPFGGGANAPYFYGVAQEVEVGTGKVLFQWRSDAHVNLAESYAPLADYGKTPWDYFHINSIGLTDDGDLLISARNTWAVYKVSRQNGDILWRLGGKRSDFAVGPGANFEWQHDVNQHPDGSMTVFDNGAGEYASEKQSRGLVLNIDPSARRVSLQRQYTHPGAPLLAGALGSVQLLPGGHVFIGWGKYASYTEFGADGETLLDGRLVGDLTESYRAFRSPWRGAPAEPPAVAVERQGGGMTVFASWNGATGVNRWLVLAGAHPNTLAEVGTAATAGFETAITVPGAQPFVAVAALGASGERLGLSKTLPT